MTARDVASRLSEAQRMDRESNIFAAYLLMPEHLLQPFIQHGINLDDDRFVERIAKQFRVPVSTAVFRLMLEGLYDE